MRVEADTAESEKTDTRQCAIAEERARPLGKPEQLDKATTNENNILDLNDFNVNEAILDSTCTPKTSHKAEETVDPKATAEPNTARAYMRKHAAKKKAR